MKFPSIKYIHKIIKRNIWQYLLKLNEFHINHTTLRSKRVLVPNLCESFCSTHIASQLDSDSRVKELVIKFVWVQMTNFSESFLSTYTLCLSSSDLWVLSTFSQGDYAMDKPRRINIDSMSILRRYKRKRKKISKRKYR